MVIIYRYNTGFTKKYAEMLGKAEKIKVYSISDVEDKLDEPIFYMGPLMAGHITGIDHAVKKFSVKGVCGVGMSPTSQQVLETLSKANYVPNVPIFYLQGGWAPKKVGWLKRRMVGMATRSIRESLQDKGGRRTAEEDQYLDFLIHGGSYVAFENLEAIQTWMRAQ